MPTLRSRLVGRAPWRHHPATRTPWAWRLLAVAAIAAALAATGEPWYRTTDDGETFDIEFLDAFANFNVVFFWVALLCAASLITPLWGRWRHIGLLLAPFPFVIGAITAYRIFWPEDPGYSARPGVVLGAVGMLAFGAAVMGLMLAMSRRDGRETSTSVGSGDVSPSA